MKEGSWLLRTLGVSLRFIIFHWACNWWWNNIRDLIVSLNLWWRTNLSRWRICPGWRCRVWSGWWWRIHAWNFITTPMLKLNKLINYEKTFWDVLKSEEIHAWCSNFFDLRIHKYLLFEFIDSYITQTDSLLYLPNSMDKINQLIKLHNQILNILDSTN